MANLSLLCLSSLALAGCAGGPGEPPPPPPQPVDSQQVAVDLINAALVARFEIRGYPPQLEEKSP